MDQLIEDAAVRRIPRIAALFTQRLQLFLELAQFADAGRNMADVFIEQGIDLATARLR